MLDQTVAERSGAGSVPPVRAPGFVGRGRELAALAGALAAGPAVVVVEGEAGIGKSRLLREYLASPEGKARKALVACCPPLARPHTLGALADALRQVLPKGVSGLGLSGLAGALRPLFPEWSGALPPAPEAAEDASAARHRVFAALAELLGCLQAGLLVVEDAQWADEATLEFLLYLSARQPVPLVLVASYRPEEIPERSSLRRLARQAAGYSGHRISLGALDEAATAGLASSMLADQHVSEEFAAFLYSNTEGVPLAAEELVRVMTSRGELALHRRGWVRKPLGEIAVPPSIRDAVLERMQRLSPDAQAVLEAAAVLAEPAGESVLAAVAGLGAARTRSGLGEALACDLLGEHARGLVAFRHVLAGLAVYDAIRGPDRRAAHRQAGLALERLSSPSAARLARHFREAGDTALWARYAEQAADVALAAGDEAAAGAILCDLIVNAGLLPAEVARLAGNIAPLALPANGQEEVVRTLEAIRDSGRLTPAEDSAVRFQLGQILMAMAEDPVGRAELERALRHGSPGLRAEQAARAMTLLGYPDASCGVSVHVRWLHRAAKTAASLEPGRRMQLLVDRASVLLSLGQEAGWAEAAQIPGEPSGPRDRLQVTRGHLNIGDAAMAWGRYGEARHRLLRAVELARRYQYWRLHDIALVTLAHLDWFTGAWDGLDSRVHPLAGNEELPLGARLEAVLVIGLLRAAAGDRPTAARDLQQVLAEALRLGNIRFMAEPAAALARIALAQDDAQAALEHTAEPARIVAWKGIWVDAGDLVPARVQALTIEGRMDEASHLVAAFSRGLRGRDAPAAKAGLVLCRAILAETRSEHARAATLFARAAAAWQVLPRPYHALLAKERQARCLLATAKPETGLPLLSEILGSLSRLGARGDAGRVARILREHGTDTRHVWRGGTRGYGDQLSPRELEVVRLAATGRTNREIGQLLCRSPRTVATQLSSAMRKLQVSSRIALAPALADAEMGWNDRSARAAQ